jgi:antitoxin component YwqK of YwqJK toxin-antitoxin module
MSGLFGKFRKTKKLISKEVEYELYAQVSDQLQQGQKETGVWTKAFADAKGDEQKARAIYIELMVARLVLAKQAKMEFAPNLEKLNSTSVNGGETIEDLIERDGIHYKKFSDAPFTGKITGQEQGSFKNGKRHGPWVYSRDNGQLRQKGTYKNGKRGGPWISYHDNGQLFDKGTYKNGKRGGPWISYHDNGQLFDKGNYKDGKRHGPWDWYYDNGQLEYEGNYKNGERNDLWRWYYENGHKETLERWKNGKKSGPSVRFDENGKRIRPDEDG